MAGGGYGLELGTDTLRIGDLELVSGLPLHLSGDADAGPPSAQLGLALTVEALIAITDATEPEAADGVRRAADLDLDGNGERESVSLSLTVSLAGCSLR